MPAFLPHKNSNYYLIVPMLLSIYEVDLNVRQAPLRRQLACLAFGTGVLGVLGVLWWLGGWVIGIRYRRGPSMVRNMRAVLKKASWGTRRIFRRLRCKKQASTVRKGYSVPETASWGTRRIQRPAEQPTLQTVDSLLGYATHF